MNRILFYYVILVANIIQGITGFAGTILAMPPGLMLVGYDIAKPVLNFLGLLSGVIVLAGSFRNVNWRELGRVLIYMMSGMVIGMLIKNALSGQMELLYKGLGVFVLILAVRGCVATGQKIHQQKTLAAGMSYLDEDVIGERAEGNGVYSFPARAMSRAGTFLMLLLAGVVHGIFVSGGPLAVAYLSKKLPHMPEFRATISTMWIVLNGFNMAEEIVQGLWTPQLIHVQILAIPFLILGMLIGGKLFKIMNQNIFMVLTYVLLIVSGVSLLFK